MFLLPDRPETTSFLNEREREIAMDRRNRGISGDVGFTVNKSKKILAIVLVDFTECALEHVAAAFKDWRVSGIRLRWV
jgi:hypothetical protein